ncbi:MAG: undecaprenyl/decaprenyl-phosphate alpha-N-acetylglucosaminyl 1-phosphate transferase [Deltaproteobacteria bacterium]|nr:undecaprenyl/decaprenyl-phosphate alpha-N-acetylglucosaminyl 1-phosphate transferase [Deltaproteobacteria bacterium]
MAGSLWITAWLLAAGFLVAVLAVPLVRRAAGRFGLMAAPGGRRTHERPTPLGGGLVIYLPLALSFLAFFALLQAGVLEVAQPDAGKMVSLWAGATWILLLGTWDDRVRLGWKKKLAGQFLASAILVLGGHTIANATLPFFGLVSFGVLGVPLFMLAVVVVVNAVNLIDGLDGLAGGIGFFAALTAALIAVAKGDAFTAVIGFTLAGSLLGFLMYNFPPASIFLGDGGSMMVGFLLGAFATSSAALQPGQRLGTSLMILVPFLPLAVPLTDVALSVARRWFTGRALFWGDGDHLHHRLGERVKNPRLTVTIFYAFSAVLSALTLLLVFQGRSPAGFWLWGLAALVMAGGTLGALALYRGKPLAVAWRDRPHFRFLGLFTRYMKARLDRARTLAECLDLLAAGVRDLGFDRVEVWREGRIYKVWQHHHPVHPERSRLQADETLADGRITVRWSRPSHVDETYNEYLMLTWHRFLVAWKETLHRHLPASPADSGGKVVELPRK